MRKSKMVSLNPEYKIEVTILKNLAEKVKDNNVDLYNILTILSASITGGDEKQLVKYCNKYLEDKVYTNELKSKIQEMLDSYKNEDDSFGISDIWDK